MSRAVSLVVGAALLAAILFGLHAVYQAGYRAGDAAVRKGDLATAQNEVATVRTALANERAGRATDRAAAAEAAASAAATYRTEEQRRTAAQREIVHAAQNAAARARADAAAVRSTDARVHQRALDLAAACGGRAPGDTQAAGGGTPAAEAGDLLAQLLVAAEQRSRELAEHADQARGAGEACERAYDALTANQPAAP